MLDEIKHYLRIDHDEDDVMIQGFIDTGKIYIKNGVGKFIEDDNLFKLALTVLVGHWYDNRELARIGNQSYPIPHSFEAIIHQLRYCHPDGEEE